MYIYIYRERERYRDMYKHILVEMDPLEVKFTLRSDPWAGLITSRDGWLAMNMGLILLLSLATTLSFQRKQTTCSGFRAHLTTLCRFSDHFLSVLQGVDSPFEIRVVRVKPLDFPILASPCDWKAFVPRRKPHRRGVAGPFNDCVSTTVSF